MRIEYISTIALLLPFSGVASTSAQGGNLSPELIIRRMSETYSSAISYQDEGIVLIHRRRNSLDRLLHEDPGPDQVRFKTYFNRPGRFKFEWISHHPYPPLRHIEYFHVSWSDGEKSYLYWDHPYRFEERERLGQAIAGAKGAHWTSCMLMREIGGFCLNFLTDLSFLRAERFEGVECYVVRGTKRNSDVPVDVWIGKNDFLVRKVTLTLSGTKHEEIHRKVRIDAEIPKATFNFQPPEKPPPQE